MCQTSEVKHWTDGLKISIFKHFLNLNVVCKAELNNIYQPFFCELMKQTELLYFLFLCHVDNNWSRTQIEHFLSLSLFFRNIVTNERKFSLNYYCTIAGIATLWEDYKTLGVSTNEFEMMAIMVMTTVTQMTENMIVYWSTTICLQIKPFSCRMRPSAFY